MAAPLFLQLFWASSIPVIKIILICGIGAFCAHKGLLTSEGRRIMGSLGFLLFNPCLIFTKLGRTLTPSRLIHWWPLILNTGLTTAIGLVLGYVTVRVIPPPKELRPHTIVSIALGNLGNLPLVIVATLAQSSNSLLHNIPPDEASDLAISYVVVGLLIPCIAHATLGFTMLKKPPADEPLAPLLSRQSDSLQLRGSVPASIAPSEQQPEQQQEQERPQGQGQQPVGSSVGHRDTPAAPTAFGLAAAADSQPDGLNGVDHKQQQDAGPRMELAAKGGEDDARPLLLQANGAVHASSVSSIGRSTYSTGYDSHHHHQNLRASEPSLPGADGECFPDTFGMAIPVPRKVSGGHLQLTVAHGSSANGDAYHGSSRLPAPLQRSASSMPRTPRGFYRMPSVAHDPMMAFRSRSLVRSASAVARWHRERVDYRAIARHMWREATSPPLLSILLSVPVACIKPLQQVLFGRDAPLALVTDCLSMLGDCTIPVILLNLGATLSNGPGAAYVPLRVTSSVAVNRLLLVPLVGVPIVLGSYAAGLFEAPDPIYLLVLLIQNTAPTAILVHTMSSITQNKDAEVSAILFWSYIISILAVPCWLTLYLWATQQLFRGPA